MPFCLRVCEIGTHHLEIGKPCQDAAGDLVLDGSVLLALADGAGSATRSAEGAHLAVEAALGAAGRACTQAGGDGGGAGMERLLETALEAARQALEREAERCAPADPMAHDSGEPLRRLATTFVFAAVWRGVVGIVHLGDGWVVAEGGDSSLTVLSGPDRGEYVNETVFLSQPGYRELARYTVRDLGDMASLILMTDGLETLFMDLVAGKPHRPAFAPLLRFARSTGSSREDKELQLHELLASKRVCTRTSDDKSLLMALLARCAEDPLRPAP